MIDLPTSSQSERHVDQATESQVCYKIYQEVIGLLCQRYPGITIINPPNKSCGTGQQRREYINSLDLDLYIFLGCYTDRSLTFTPIAYQLDVHEGPLQKGFLIPVHQAHLHQRRKERLADKVHASLEAHVKRQYYTLHPTLSAPIKQLYGLLPSAVMLDIGINSSTDLKLAAAVIVDLLVTVSPQERS